MYMYILFIYIYVYIYKYIYIYLSIYIHICIDIINILFEYTITAFRFSRREFQVLGPNVVRVLSPYVAVLPL